jgi:excisionase family DNA binding protein
MYTKSYIGNGLTVKQVAKLLNFTENKVYRLVRKKKIPHYRKGRSIRFDPEKLYKWYKEYQTNRKLKAEK